MEYRDLVTKAKTGEPEATGALYNQFFERIYRFIYFRVGHKETAEDLTEEVFIKAFSKLHTVQKEERFSSWLYQIAKNQIIDHYRKNVSSVALEDVEHLLEYESGIAESLDTTADKKLVLICLEKLPREQRLVLNMKFFEELDNATIGRILSKKEGAIRVIQHRALAKLKTHLSEIL